MNLRKPVDMCVGAELRRSVNLRKPDEYLEETGRERLEGDEYVRS